MPRLEWRRASTAIPWGPVHSESTLARLLAATVYAGDGQPIGRVTAAYLGAEDGRPTWVAVRATAGDDSERILPLAQAWLHPGDRLVVPVARNLVAASPALRRGDLSRSQEDVLLGFYGDYLGGMPRRQRDSDRGDQVRLRRVEVAGSAGERGTTAVGEPQSDHPG